MIFSMLVHRQIDMALTPPTISVCSALLRRVSRRSAAERYFVRVQDTSQWAHYRWLPNNSESVLRAINKSLPSLQIVVLSTLVVLEQKFPAEKYSDHCE
jgi:hypothetical protein